jgi:hypothetical protein
MTPNDIDLVRIIAEYTRQRATREGTSYAATEAEVNRRTNLRLLAAKCGEVLARTLYGIDINRHSKQ